MKYYQADPRFASKLHYESLKIFMRNNVWGIKENDGSKDYPIIIFDLITKEELCINQEELNKFFTELSDDEVKTLDILT